MYYYVYLLIVIICFLLQVCLCKWSDKWIIQSLLIMILILGVVICIGIYLGSATSVSVSVGAENRIFAKFLAGHCICGLLGSSVGLGYYKCKKD